MHIENTYMMNFKLSLIALFVVIALGANAQENKSDNLQDFKIIISRTANGITLTGEKGTAWTELSFGLADNTQQAIDEYGMTSLKKVNPEIDQSLTNFLIIVTKKGQKIILKGLQGTAWTELTFSIPLNKKQAINQFGMVD